MSPARTDGASMRRADVDITTSRRLGEPRAIPAVTTTFVALALRTGELHRFEPLCSALF
jgi:hypothetical protein